MSEGLLVSIIIPVYNVEKYLPECVHSVLKQTYSDIEIILVDDGSLDNSSRLCDEFAKNEKKITVIHKKNGGLASARNTGLEHAKGKYVYFVDSDDCIHPQLIERTVGIAEEYQTQIVQVELEMVEEGFHHYQKTVREGKLQFFSVLQALQNLDKDNQFIATDIRLTTTVVWNKLYRRDIFEKVRFGEGIRIHEDQMIIHRLLIAGGGMVFYDSPLHFYRSNQSSLMHRKWQPDKLIIIDCYSDRLQSVLELPVSKEQYQVVSLIYYRYLVCIFKNYIMIDKYMDGIEKQNKELELYFRLKKTMKARYGQLPLKMKLVFRFFLWQPKIFIKVYRLFSHRKEGG